MQVWVQGESEANMLAMARELNSGVGASKKEFKAFIIIMTSSSADVAAARRFAARVEQGKLTRIGVATVPATDSAVRDYKVSRDKAVKNTVMFYANRRVVSKFVNLQGDAAGIRTLRTAITRVQQ